MAFLVHHIYSLAFSHISYKRFFLVSGGKFNFFLEQPRFLFLLITYLLSEHNKQTPINYGPQPLVCIKLAILCVFNSELPSFFSAKHWCPEYIILLKYMFDVFNSHLHFIYYRSYSEKPHCTTTRPNNIDFSVWVHFT